MGRNPKSHNFSTSAYSIVFLLQALCVLLSLASESRRTVVFVSSQRGGEHHNRACSYERPCSSLKSITHHVESPTLEIVLLSGEYTNKTILEWRGRDFHDIDILLRGQRDCFPLPANDTQCNSALPIISSLLVDGEDRRINLTMKNLIIAPRENLQYGNTTSTPSTCKTLCESQHALRRLDVFNITIDVSHLEHESNNACISLLSTSTQDSSEFVRFSDIIFARPMKMLELAIYTKSGLQSHFSNWHTPSPAPHAGLVRFNVLPEPQAQLFFSNLPRIYNLNLFDPSWRAELRGQGVEAFLDHVDLAGKGTIQVSRLQVTNSTFFFTFMNLNAINIVFDDNQLQHSMVNLTGHSTSFPAKVIMINRNTLEVSTLYLDATETSTARYNSFIGSASTISGLLLPPIMNLYLNSYDSSIFQSPHQREPPGVIDARFNFWNKASGPSTCCNPEGQGSPILWMTDFSNWCIDSNCSIIHEGPDELNHTLTRQSLQSMPSCYYESYCAPADQYVLWSIVGIEITIALVGLFTCIVFAISRYPDPYTRWKRMATTICIVGIVYVIMWTGEAGFLLQTRNLFDNIVWKFTDDLAQLSLFVLVGDGILFGIALALVLFVLYRKSEPQFKGLRLAFISLVVVGNLFTYVGTLAQMIPPLIKVTLYGESIRDFPDNTLLPILKDGYNPSPRSWMPWGTAMVACNVTVVSLAVCIWRILRLRDYREFDEIRSEVETRYSLLGATPSLLLRGQTTSSRSRRVAFLYLIPTLCCIATGMLLFEARVEFSTLQKYADIGILSLGATVGLAGFFLFFWSFYRVAVLWLHVALSIFQAISTAGIMTFWILWRVKFHDSNVPDIQGAEIAVYAVGSFAVVTFSASALFASSFVQWATPILAGDVNLNVQNRMEDVYDHD